MITAKISHIEYSPSKQVTFVRCRPDALFTFQEWQFMMISSSHIHEGLGKPLKKPYSIATTNQELQEKWTIGFVVKNVREGFMSEYLTTGIEVWDILHLQWPLGHMTNTHAHDNYLLVSVGSGLSPMLGLYESIVAKQQDAKVVMLYGERYANQILPSTLELFSKTSGNTKKTLFLSREKDTPSIPISCHYQDWYVQDWLDEALTFLDTTDISVFICGKPEMVDDTRKHLSTHWIDPQHVKFEKY